MNQQLVRRTEDYLRAMLDRGRFLSANPPEKRYRLEHSYRVANLGRQIAQSEGFDETELVIACLLHDVSYCEDFGETGWAEHGRRSAYLSRPFLESLGLAPDRIDEICYAIAIHVDDRADFPGERTPFALSVGDADNIDRFDVYRIHETLCRDRFLELSPEEKRDYLEQRLPRLRELSGMQMGTKTAEALWDKRLSFYIRFFEKLLSQLKCSAGLVE